MSREKEFKRKRGNSPLLDPQAGFLLYTGGLREILRVGMCRVCVKAPLFRSGAKKILTDILFLSKRVNGRPQGGGGFPKGGGPKFISLFCSLLGPIFRRPTASPLIFIFCVCSPTPATPTWAPCPGPAILPCAPVSLCCHRRANKCPPVLPSKAIFLRFSTARTSPHGPTNWRVHSALPESLQEPEF